MTKEICAGMHEIIRATLDRIEHEHDAHILFAVESGSRAWGFASPDSDYDVRFVYARPVDWYLSLREGRDVIELPIDGDLDVNGWDIRKALILLLKGNPALLEWLNSPIVYRAGAALTALAGLAARIDHRTAARHHYLHLGRTQFRRQIDGREDVPLKKYFYCLRPAAALRWDRSHDTGRIPMDLPTLLAEIDLDPALRGLIADLLDRKAQTSELGSGPRIPAIDHFVQDEFHRAAARSPQPPEPDAEVQKMAEALFRHVVRAVSARTG